MTKRILLILALVAVVLLIGISTASYLGIRAAQGPWYDVRDTLLPQFMPAENKEQVPLIHEPFSENIDIGVVINKEQTYVFVDPGMLNEWGVSQEAVFNQALKNLEKYAQHSSIEVAETGDGKASGKYAILEIDDGYAAVRLLTTGVRKAMAKEFGDTYIAAIPTRDFLIFWHPEFPLTDAFLKQVEVEYAEGGTYKLTSDPFLVTKFGIQPLTKEDK